MKTKANVQVFDDDVLSKGLYKYTDSEEDVAKRFSNSRTSSAIAQATVFKDKKVLDVGCGDGVFTLELAKLGVQSVLGIDPAAKAVMSATQRTTAAGVESFVGFKTFNIYDLDADYGKFDIVVLRGVLHHLPAPAKALQAVSRICDEIIIVEPNGCNPVLKLIEKFSTYHIMHEEQSFTPWTIDEWLRLSGKRPTKRQLINFVPLFCPSFLARILKMLEPIVEALPLVRLIGCGQYIVTARS